LTGRAVTVMHGCGAGLTLIYFTSLMNNPLKVDLSTAIII